MTFDASMMTWDAARWPEPVARPLPGFTLQPPHPLAGREAMQCVKCDGIFYPDPTVLPLVCPYCDDASE